MFKKRTYVIDKSSNVFFTSDPHWGHTNVIRFDNRPFADIDTMNWKMISEWNSTVNPNDVVLILGDVSYANLEETVRIVSQLNGKKHLVLGNHDRVITDNLATFKQYFESITRDREIAVRYEGVEFNVTLSHYMHVVWNKSHHGALHLWGHSHGKIAGHTQGCDVGMPVWGYKPASFERILSALKTNQKYPDCFGKILENDHHVSRNKA